MDSLKKKWVKRAVCVLKEKKDSQQLSFLFFFSISYISPPSSYHLSIMEYNPKEKKQRHLAPSLATHERRSASKRGSTNMLCITTTTTNQRTNKHNRRWIWKQIQSSPVQSWESITLLFFSFFWGWNHQRGVGGEEEVFSPPLLLNTTLSLSLFLCLCLSLIATPPNSWKNAGEKTKKKAFTNRVGTFSL